MNFVMQSKLGADLHVGIIMDGNGRWATARGRPRLFGHHAGVQSVDRTVEAARRLSVDTLTLYAFSADNWKRPPAEVEGLMRLFHRHLSLEVQRCRTHGIRLRVIGRRDRLSGKLRRAIEVAESSTEECRGMNLQLAVDYSGRDAIRAAAADDRGVDFAARLARAMHTGPETRDVDLIIRTGGERRLSDFLLWEAAYAELYFTDLPWPEFGAGELGEALRWFRSRKRRFGTVDEPAYREVSAS